MGMYHFSCTEKLSGFGISVASPVCAGEGITVRNLPQIYKVTGGSYRSQLRLLIISTDSNIFYRSSGPFL